MTNDSYAYQTVFFSIAATATDDHLRCFRYQIAMIQTAAKTHALSFIARTLRRAESASMAKITMGMGAVTAQIRTAYL